MALGIRLGLLLSLPLAACAPDGQAQNEQPSDDGAVSEPAEAAGIQSVAIAGVEIELVELGRTCGVLVEGEQIELSLPPPCRLLARGNTGSATVEDYGEAGAVVLIAGPLAAQGDYALSEDRNPQDQCSHIAQSLLVKDGAVVVGEPMVESLGFCSNAAPDEKFYYGIAHPEG
ncbi:hypothetical protein [uncultured Erythrobacter sp.]|uniref:hypothetical protein n=1 Tax=uncultured Erythrobacter sp. TaxID=263913 RepID=UPI00261CCD95|nr:hypothetical protein [uncultured Erythrobacter sp.]